MSTTAERLGTVLCGVGESPIWRRADQAFYWTDIPGKTLWRWTPETGAFAQWALPQMAGSIPSSRARPSRLRANLVLRGFA